MAARRPRTLNARHYAGLAVGLLALTVYGSIIPLRYQPMAYEEAIARYRGARLYDATLIGARGDWVVNGMQYAVLSFCAAAALSVDLRGIFRLAAAAVVVPMGFLAASWIEFLQVYFPPRTVSVNDLVVERVGVVAGALAWLLAGQPLTGWARRFWELKGLSGLARQALPLYVAALVVASLVPFDFVLGAGELAAKARQGRIELVPFGGLGDGGAGAWLGLLLNMAMFAPLGVLAACVPRRAAVSWPAILGLGLGVTATIEALQLLVFTRYCDVTDVVSGTTAAMAGWWAAASIRDGRAASRLGGRALHDGWNAVRAALHRGNTRPATAWAIAAAWAVILVVASWQPYTFTADPGRFAEADADLSDEDTRVLGLRRIAWAPFVDYYWGSRYNALDQFLMRSLSFAPIGVALALAFGRRERAGRATTVLVATALAVLIEAGQYVIPDRHPGTTDLIIQVFGAWLGCRSARHVAHALGPDRDALGEARYRVVDLAPRPSPRPTRAVGAIPGLGLQALVAGLATAIARRFDPLPLPAKLALLGAAAALLSVVLVLLVDRLGLL